MWFIDKMQILSSATLSKDKSIQDELRKLDGN